MLSSTRRPVPRSTFPFTPKAALWWSNSPIAGPGIPEELADRVFEKFYRLPREGASGGAGLGLSICRAIVEAHGGRIWAENRGGGGAVFRFTVPIEGSPPELAPEDER